MQRKISIVGPICSYPPTQISFLIALYRSENTRRGKNPYFHSVDSQNPKFILWLFSSNTGKIYSWVSWDLNCFLTPRVGLELKFGALSSLVKRLSSHPVIKYKKTVAPRRTGPCVVIIIVSPSRSPTQSLMFHT